MTVSRIYFTQRRKVSPRHKEYMATFVFALCVLAWNFSIFFDLIHKQPRLITDTGIVFRNGSIIEQFDLYISCSDRSLNGHYSISIRAIRFKLICISHFSECRAIGWGRYLHGLRSPDPIWYYLQCMYLVPTDQCFSNLWSEYINNGKLAEYMKSQAVKGIS